MLVAITVLYLIRDIIGWMVWQGSAATALAPRYIDSMSFAHRVQKERLILDQ
jgi:hypothetical protein